MAEAEDRWETELFESSFGGIRIDVQSTADTHGRVLATHQIPHRDAHPVRDQGGEPRVTRCRVVFFATSPDDDYRERFYFFKDLVDQGIAATFVHPISGRYRARVGEFQWSASAEERDVIRVECTFHEDADTPATFETGRRASPAVGATEVRASAAAVQDALAEYNAGLVDVDGAEPLTTAAPDEAVALAERWEAVGESGSGGIGLRDVNLELVRVSNLISAETDRLELAMDLERHPILVALQNLHHNLRRAAQTVLDDGPSVIEVTLKAPTSVYALAARIYRGDPAIEQRVDELLRLNDIPNPARLEPGRYRAMSPTDAERGRARRRA